MAKRKTTESGEPYLRKRHSETPEGRENEMIALSFDCAERMMREGRASSQIICHFLKLGTRKYEYELEKLKTENQLAAARTEQIEAEKKTGELYADAIRAMGVYSGTSNQEEQEDEEDI